MALLKEAGFEADAVDLTGSGIDATDSNSITSFAQYVKPLVDFLENLGDGQKVLSLPLLPSHNLTSIILILSNCFYLA